MYQDIKPQFPESQIYTQDLNTPPANLNKHTQKYKTNTKTLNPHLKQLNTTTKRKNTKKITNTKQPPTS